MIIIASDHAGFALKEKLLNSGFLDDFDSDVIDLNHDFDPDDDYPDIVQSITMIQGHQQAKIIGICGSGQGICIALNKLRHVRSGIGYSEISAKEMRHDNNANGICFSGQRQSLEQIKTILKIFLTCDFGPEPRHKRRVEKLDKLDDMSDK